MKKLLLVAVSVGVFLLVTITIALIVLTPKTNIQETAFSSSVPHTNVRPIPNIMSNMPAQPETVDIPAISLSEDNERLEVTFTSDRNDGTNMTIHVPVPIHETPVRTPVTIAPAPTRPAATQTTAPAVNQTAAATTRPATQTAPRTQATPVRTINDYWIQTGAYPSMVGAEDVREILAENGLVGIVSIFDNQERDGRTWYRVRLGPYTSEREANHWLAIVKSINGFHESQLRQTIRQQ